MPTKISKTVKKKGGGSTTLGRPGRDGQSKGRVGWQEDIKEILEANNLRWLATCRYKKLNRKTI